MSDDYLTAPAAQLTRPERILLRDLATEAAAQFGPACLIVNIGVGLGGSALCLHVGAPAARIIGIDIDPASMFGPWEFWHEDSRRCAWRVIDPISLLFIDGDHNYYGVRADALLWAPKIAEGGVMAFHDYEFNEAMQPMTTGVKRAVDECIGDGWAEVTRVDSIKAFRRVT